MKDKLSESQWNHLLAALPLSLRNRAARDSVRYREFIDNVLWLVEQDQSWVSLCPSYATWRSAYMRFQRWTDNGTWNRVAQALAQDDQGVADKLMRRVDESRRSRSRRGHRSGDAAVTDLNGPFMGLHRTTSAAVGRQRPFASTRNVAITQQSSDSDGVRVILQRNEVP